MNYYNQGKYMNREERRKNGIKAPKASNTVKHYTNADLEKVLKRELMELKNESMSDYLKRQRYERLKPLIEEYQKANSISKKKLNEPQRIYQIEQEKLKNNPVYKNLNSKIASKTTFSTSQNTIKKRAIVAYETQIEYSTQSKRNYSKSKKAHPKGLLARICDIFKSKKRSEAISYNQTIVKPKNIEGSKQYKNNWQQNSYNTNDYVYNDFEKELRNFKNYSKINPTYQCVINGNNITQSYNRNGRYQFRNQRREPRFL